MTVVVLVLLVAAVVATLAVIGYRMGPAPGQPPVTRRDRRIQEEIASNSAFRMQANPNLRSDRDTAAMSLAAAAVTSARERRIGDPSLNETEALADALVELDRLERQSTSTTIAPLVVAVLEHLTAVGVLDDPELDGPELTALLTSDIASNPGIAVRIIGVRSLEQWP